MDPNVWLTTLVNDLEGKVFHIGLYFGIGEFTTDETLGIEDTWGESTRRSRPTAAEENSRVVWVLDGLVFCGITDETSDVREGNIGWGRLVTLFIDDDLDMIILPDADTTGCG